ncbi:MAG: MarR family transcriptional regulator [Bacteroidetes bacterium]|nr:MarR family transcriptional regulator [Bacteroidota bacterium]
MARKNHHTPSFLKENDSLRQNILLAASMFRENMRHFIQPFGLTPKQLEILQILRIKDAEKLGMTILEIRDAMNDSKPDTSRLVRRLQEKKLVDCKKGKEDRRFTRVHLSIHGQKILSEVDRRRPELLQLTSHLSEKDVNDLNRLLKKLQGQPDSNHTGL